MVKKKYDPDTELRAVKEQIGKQFLELGAKKFNKLMTEALKRLESDKEERIEKRKTFYADAKLLSEMKEVAQESGHSFSWLIRQAWKHYRSCVLKERHAQ